MYLHINHFHLKLVVQIHRSLRKQGDKQTAYRVIENYQETLRLHRLYPPFNR